MIYHPTARARRRGTILPLVVLTMVGMCGFVALGVDIGLIAVAKTQVQNAVDAGSVSGARSIDGSTSQNIGAVGTTGSAYDNAMTVTQANLVLKDTIQTSNVTIRFGAWHYDTSAQQFVPQFPPVSPDNYNLCEVTASYNVNTTFAPVFQIINSSFNSSFTVTATAQAAHRPRDVALVLDYSGSMNNESDLWNNESYLDNGSTNTTNGYVWPQASNPNYTSNNMDPVYPLFGHYVGSSGTAKGASGNDYSDYTKNPNLLSPAAATSSPLYWNTSTSSTSLIGKSNVTQSVQGVQALVDDFYQNARIGSSGNLNGTVTQAFTAASNAYATTPGGDNYLSTKNTNTSPITYATTVNDILASSSLNATWELQGYKSAPANAGNPPPASFKGYTIGPKYWGKTFFIWPPDPTNDWRSKYFNNDPNTAGNSLPLTGGDNTKLFQNSYPGYKDPAGNYQINYKAILSFIKNTGTNPFPSLLRSGSVILYDSIPTDVPAAAYDHTQPNYNIADPNQRFWKEYIDWTLGVWRAPSGGIQHTQQPACSIGPDFTYGTVQISAPPGGGQYMNYKDNPWRPRHRLWFGPMTMVQFMMDTGLLPGTSHDISMFPMKQGVGGALLDIQNNHPNNLVSMILYNRPKFNNDPKGMNGFTFPQFNLSNDYPSMLNALWLPPGGTSADVRLWDSNNDLTLVPRAFGDYTSNTTSIHGLMLAYNQMSGNSTVLTAAVGGGGRKGAARMIVYETDGMANETSIPAGGFVTVPTGQSPIGAYNSYYAILPGQTVDGGGYDANALLQVVQALCNLDTGAPYASPYPNYPSGFNPPTNLGLPGYSTPNKPVLVHCIAFGAIFETPNSIQTSSVSLLQQISAIGNTVFPSSPSDPTNGYKWCIGSLSDRQTKLQQAFLTILDSSVPVSLIK